MVSTRPLISKSSSSCTNPLVTVLRIPLTIGVNVPLMLDSFFSSLAKSRYVYHFSLSFSFTQWLTETGKFIIRKILFVLFVCFFCFFVCLFLLFFFTITSSGRVSEIILYFCISKSCKSLCVSFSWTDFGLCIYHLLLLLFFLLLLSLLLFTH